MKIPLELHQQLTAKLALMERERAPWISAWREISDYFLPRRYVWLLTDKEQRSAAVRNQRLLSSVSILALRTLATGMMNGITSPARPWFRLRLTGLQDEEAPHDAQVWLEEATKRMLQVMAESNFYNAIGVFYLEWAGFGTASMSINEDFQDIIRCRNHAIGEFFIETDENNRQKRFARKFRLTVENAARQFGAEALPERHRLDYEAGHPRRSNPVDIYHLIEPNQASLVRASAPYQSLYWVAGTAEPELLAASPLDEFPTITARWDTYGTDNYGTSPCMDALGDVIQLQHLIKRRAQGLDKTITPPMLVNQTLANKPKAMTSGGITYVAGQDLNSGARPTYQIQVPFQEIAQDLINIRTSIQQVLFNDLFRMISELDTVRSATEIDARREEKLVLLGPVLERFESEGLTPAIERIFRICERAGVFPEPPESLASADIQIQYVSILADAQRAVGTVAIERWLQVIGNIVQVAPDEALDIPDWEEILREYGDSVGVKKKLQRSREAVEERRAAREAAQQQQQALEVGGALATGAEQLSNTDLGGGQNALAAALGGAL